MVHIFFKRRRILKIKSLEKGSVEMKKSYFYLIPVFLLGIIIFYMADGALANRGQQYYEEAGHIIKNIDTKEKVVALTFDDGPHWKYTPQILDLLDQYEAKATFFIVGRNAEKNPDIILRMYRTGHELANHTYTHPSTTAIPKVMKEIKQTNDTIFSMTGFTPTLFRPVEGNYTHELVDEVVKDGFKVVLWTWYQDTQDWRDPGVDKIVNTVLDGKKEGNIILFHDGGERREQTVQALEKILPELVKQGYKFVTISDLLELQKDGENNIDSIEVDIEDKDTEARDD